MCGVGTVGTHINGVLRIQHPFTPVAEPQLFHRNGNLHGLGFTGNELHTLHSLARATAEEKPLREKSIDKITIKEICEAAGLNRGTFYLHYDYPAALLSDIENQFLEKNTRLFHSFWHSSRDQSIMAALFAGRMERLGHHALMAISDF